MKRNSRAEKWLLFWAVLFILTTGHRIYAAEYQCPGSLKTDLENVQRARAMSPGIFVRLDQNTLKFEGHIDRGTYKSYLDTVDDNVKTLVINSSGGDSYDGVRIGLDLAKRNMEVIVDGVAGSSAANYLFTAGKHKKICRGFVGFHGNAGAAKQKEALEESIRNSAAKTGLNREQIERTVKETLAITEETITLEKEFFTKLGISQKLFDITQLDSKGLDPDMKINFEFLLPSIGTMEKFGIRNVAGQQDIGLAERLGLRIIYY